MLLHIINFLMKNLYCNAMLYKKKVLLRKIEFAKYLKFTKKILIKNDTHLK